MNWMKVALRLAEDTSPVANAKLVALVVRGNELVSVGWNQKKSHPLQKRFSSNPERIFLHAEVDAIIKGFRRGTLEDCDLIIARVKRDGPDWVSGLAKPCEGCQRAIKWSGVKGCYWSEDICQH